MSNVISKFAVPKIPPKRFEIKSIITAAMRPSNCSSCKKS